MQNVLADPEVLQGMLTSNPQIQQLMEVKTGRKWERERGRKWERERGRKEGGEKRERKGMGDEGSVGGEQNRMEVGRGS